MAGVQWQKETRRTTADLIVLKVQGEPVVSDFLRMRLLASAASASTRKAATVQQKTDVHKALNNLGRASGGLACTGSTEANGLPSADQKG